MQGIFIHKPISNMKHPMYNPFLSLPQENCLNICSNLCRNKLYLYTILIW